MKKILFMGVIGLFLLGSCNSKSGEGQQSRNGRTRPMPGHDHEGHDHENEGPGHHHDDGHHHGEETVAAHSDEIILPPAKAQAAGVAVSTIEPGVFNQVIKTSGQVMAAQGDESVAVATVAGVVSFHGKVIEGMSVGKGTPLVVLSSKIWRTATPYKERASLTKQPEKSMNG